MGKYYVQGLGKYTMYNPDGTIYEEGIECPSSTFELEKSAEFTPENHNIDNDNELLKPENHNKEFFWTLDLTKAPIDKPTMTKFFKLLCSGMKPPKHIRTH